MECRHCGLVHGIEVKFKMIIVTVRLVEGHQVPSYYDTVLCSNSRLLHSTFKKKKKKKNYRLCHQVPRYWPHTTACRSPGHGIGRPGLMVTYPENVQRNRWLGILDLILRTGNGVLEGLPGPPVVGGGCDSIQNGGQIRINPPPPRGDLVAPLHYLHNQWVQLYK